MSCTDVLIIGAGPAGCAAAIQCAQRGLSVVLMDADAAPHFRAGETLHPGVEPLLARLGVDQLICGAGFLRHTGIWVQTGECRRFQPYAPAPQGPWYGFQAWRPDFDELLLRQAERCGVCIRRPCRGVTLLRQGDRISGAVTGHGPLHARFTFDATGAKRWLSRQLGLQYRRLPPGRIVQYGYVTGECPARDDAPLFLDEGDGWTWTARVRPGVYQWTRHLTPGERISRTWMPDEFSSLKPLGPVRASDVSWGIVDACAGPGYFLLGDAAAMLDPAASHGILRALMSGMLAGYLAGRIILDCADEASALYQYRAWTTSFFEGDVKRLSRTRIAS